MTATTEPHRHAARWPVAGAPRPGRCGVRGEAGRWLLPSRPAARLHDRWSNTTTGEVGRYYSSADELDGITYVKCGNRRAAGLPDLLDGVQGRRLAPAAVRPGRRQRHPRPRCPIIRARSRPSPPPRSAPCTGSATEGTLPGPAGQAGLPARPPAVVHQTAPRRRPAPRVPAVRGLLRLHRPCGLAVARPRAVAPVHHRPATRPRRGLRPVGEPVPGPGPDLLLQGRRVPGPRRHPPARPDPPRRPRRTRRPRPRPDPRPGHRRARGRDHAPRPPRSPWTPHRSRDGTVYRLHWGSQVDTRSITDTAHRDTDRQPPGWCIPNRSPPTSRST